MSLKNVLATKFLGSLTQAERDALLKLGEDAIRDKLIGLAREAQPDPTLPKGWTISLEMVEIIINYNDPRWVMLPKSGLRKQFNSSLTKEDFLVGDRKGWWKVTFRWLQKQKGGCSVGEALEAIKASGFLGASYPELETMMDTYPRKYWVGFTSVRKERSVCSVSNNGGFRRRYLVESFDDRWRGNNLFPVVCSYTKC